MISIEQLSVEFGGIPLFDDISFLINPKERIALVGRNGAGKTTLLRLINDEILPTSGRIIKPKDLTVGYLPQQMQHEEGSTVFEEAEKAFAHITELQAELDIMLAEIQMRTDYESDEYHRLIDKLSHTQEYLHVIEDGNYHSEIEKTLLGLGFLRSDFERPCSEFSGGWRMRIELAKIILKRPDILLLDEPTNHLDIESIQWLENFLISSGSAVILVSHDRAFIDAITTRTIEISLGRIFDYPVNYSKYLELRKERYEQQVRAYENQQKKIQDTEVFIERFRYKATKAVQVQSRIKQLEKMDMVEIEEEDRSRLNLKFPPAPHSGIIPLELEAFSKSYDDYLVLDDINMIINRGEKVAFVGKNGEGKTTLVKCIMQELEYSGVLKLGHQVQIGYFAQNQAALLDDSLTVFETIDHVAVGDIRTKIRDILGAFMFGSDDIDKKVAVLSGGERSRLAMIRLLLEPVNLLILDEPTNHLDMSSKDVLKDAIKAFTGTAIIVSHDREFLDGLVDKVYEFGNKKIREHLGGIYDFLEYKKITSLQELEAQTQVQSQTEKDADKSVSDNKIQYELRRELNRKIRRLERNIEDAEKSITDIEGKIEAMEEQLQIPEKASDPDFVMDIQKKQNQLEKKLNEWERLGEELEELKMKSNES